MTDAVHTTEGAHDGRVRTKESGWIRYSSDFLRGFRSLPQCREKPIGLHQFADKSFPPVRRLATSPLHSISPNMLGMVVKENEFFRDFGVINRRTGLKADDENGLNSRERLMPKQSRLGGKSNTSAASKARNAPGIGNKKANNKSRIKSNDLQEDNEAREGDPLDKNKKNRFPIPPVAVSATSGGGVNNAMSSSQTKRDEWDSPVAVDGTLDLRGMTLGDIRTADSIMQNEGMSFEAFVRSMRNGNGVSSRVHNPPPGIDPVASPAFELSEEDASGRVERSIQNSRLFTQWKASSDHAVPLNFFPVDKGVIQGAEILSLIKPTSVTAHHTTTTTHTRSASGVAKRLTAGEFFAETRRAELSLDTMLQHCDSSDSNYRDNCPENEIPSHSEMGAHPRRRHP